VYSLTVSSIERAALRIPYSQPDSSVGMDNRGLRIPFLEEARNFQTMSRPHVHLVPRLRMRAAISPLSQHVLMMWRLIKYRDSFTFTLYNFSVTATSTRGYLRSVPDIYIAVHGPRTALHFTESTCRMQSVSARF
jgi:hypothetical protein